MSNFRVLAHDEVPCRSDYPDDAIFFFDFDGVLIDQTEDKLFRLPEQDGERERLEKIASVMGIRHDIYVDTPYLRHLTYQQEMRLESCDPHHITAFAKALHDPYCVLTARSGFSAIQRMMIFLLERGLRPQEVFCLGRVPKAHHLQLMLDQWQDKAIVFFEDTQKHIDAALALNNPRLHVTQVTWPTCFAKAEKLRHHHLNGHWAAHYEPR